jgi:hypothetical protein
MLSVRAAWREQRVGGVFARLARADIHAAVLERLAKLEQAREPALEVAAGLLRFATARYIVHDMLPSGRPVTYVPDVGEDIPSIVASDGREAAHAVAGDFASTGGDGPAECDESQARLAPAARRFFVPEWVICDDMDRLLADSPAQARARLADMQAFLAVLQVAVSLAPYFVADTEYQRKRYGMLGQLVNQGRGLARYYTTQIILKIQQRAWAQDLNRGLSLSLPYFDDRDLELRLRDFKVIPAGRILFAPALVVCAAREEQARVSRDTRLNGSTRRHLLSQLRSLERAFARVPQGWRAPTVKTMA